MATTKPNVLILYADQFRADAMGCAGNQIVRTPHLDRLCSEGRRFTRAFTVDPLCTPSRGSFMTGRYPHSTGVTHNKVLLPAHETCVSEVLSRNGYLTAYIGKWHLDGEAIPGFIPRARRHGWDYWAGFNRGHRYFDGVYYLDSPEEIPTPGFEPDHQTDLLIRYLEAVASDDKPFCAMVAWGPPHTPLVPPERYKDAYDPALMPVPRSVPPIIEERARREAAQYYGLVSALDDNVGRIAAALDRLHVANDTIVFFTSDHGDLHGEHGRFRKNVAYDEATQVPCIFRWPAAIAPGTTAGHFLCSVDIMPTLLACCGLETPEDVQGIDQSRLLFGDDGERRSSVYMEGWAGPASQNPALSEEERVAPAATHELPATWRALRTSDHLVCVDVQGTVRGLFDLEQDPLAIHNLAGLPGAAAVQDRLSIQLREEARVLGDDWRQGIQRR